MQFTLQLHHILYLSYMFAWLQTCFCSNLPFSSLNQNLPVNLGKKIPTPNFCPIPSCNAQKSWSVAALPNHPVWCKPCVILLTRSTLWKRCRFNTHRWNNLQFSNYVHGTVQLWQFATPCSCSKMQWKPQKSVINFAKAAFFQWPMCAFSHQADSRGPVHPEFTWWSNKAGKRERDIHWHLCCSNLCFNFSSTCSDAQLSNIRDILSLITCSWLCT